MTKTPRENVESWIRLFSKGLFTAADAAAAIELQISSSGDATLFQLIPPEVLTAMREDVALFRQHGRWVIGLTESGVDHTEAMRSFSDLMHAAGLID